jgi:hypothetical protein
MADDERVESTRPIPAFDGAHIKKPLSVPVAGGILSGREIKPPVKPVETGEKKE